MKTDRMSKLKNFIRNNPLIVSEPSLAALNPGLIKNPGGSLFFGVGVVSKTDLSTGMPFDILAFFFTAEKLRQILNFERVVVLIGDVHAISNQIFPVKKVNQVAKKTLNTSERVITNFDLGSFELVLGSKICERADFQAILNKIPEMENQYLKLEIADCLWLQKNKNLKIKLGWTMRKDNQEIGHDERFFDREIKKFCPNLSFVHLKPGRTFDRERPRVSPYLSIEGENRIILEENEPVAQKIASARTVWPDKHLGGTIRHLTSITRDFESIFGKLGKIPVEQKIQLIINQALSKKI
jgi:hypothetical protein